MLNIRKTAVFFLSIMLLTPAVSFAELNVSAEFNFDAAASSDEFDKIRRQYEKAEKERTKQEQADKEAHELEVLKAEKNKQDILEYWESVKAKEVLKAFGGEMAEDFFYKTVAPKIRKAYGFATPRIKDYKLIFGGSDLSKSVPTLYVEKYFPNGVVYSNVYNDVIWYDKPAYLTYVVTRSKEFILKNKEKNETATGNIHISKNRKALVDANGGVWNFAGGMPVEGNWDAYIMDDKGNILPNSRFNKIPFRIPVAWILGFEKGNPFHLATFTYNGGKMYENIYGDYKEIVSNRKNAMAKTGISEETMAKVLKSDFLTIQQRCLPAKDEVDYGYADFMITGKNGETNEAHTIIVKNGRVEEFDSELSCKTEKKALFENKLGFYALVNK